MHVPPRKHGICKILKIDRIDLVCSTEMGQAGKGAHYKFMIVQPNSKWMQEISDLIEQVASALRVSKENG